MSGTASKIKFGTGLGVTDEGAGVIRVDASGGGGGAPTGAAGGALDGSYPNPGLAASVAGAGLTETSDVLSVNVDGTTLGISSDTLRVTPAGIHLDDLGDVTAPTPADEQVLAWDSGGNNWQPKSAVLQTIADAKGDLVAASGADAMARLPVGSNGQALVADSTQTLGVKWTTLPGGGMVADTLWDAKGDLAVGTAADTGARLPVGANNQVLVADSSQSTGLKWGAVPSGSGGAMTLLSTTTLGSAGTFDVSSISGAYNDLICVLIGRGADAGNTDTPNWHYNNDSGSNYNNQNLTASVTAASATQSGAGTTFNNMGPFPAGASVANLFGVTELTLFGYASTTWIKAHKWHTFRAANNTTGLTEVLGGGIWNSTAAINRIQVANNTTPNFITGSQLRIYGRL